MPLRSAPAAPPSEPQVSLARTKVSTGATPPRGESIAGQAIVVSNYGGPDMLVSRGIEAPPPGLGEVRLRHTAVGVNFIDVYCRTGYFQLIEPPGIPGMEAAGVVLDIGEGVGHLTPGDRVAYACLPPGAYCDMRTMPAELVVPLPDAIEDTTAAAVMLKGMTADFLLRRVHPIQTGETVLVHAASGGVGSLLCQWAHHLGATVIGAVGSEGKIGLAREHGCTDVLLYGREDFVERVMALTGGRGADVVYDAIGQATLQQSFESLAIRGHLVSFGQASGHIQPIDIAEYASRSATISRPNFGHYTGTAAEVQDSTARLFSMIASGQLRPHIGLTLPLEQAEEAHRRLENRDTTGSIVLTTNRSSRGAANSTRLQRSTVSA